MGNFDGVHLGHQQLIHHLIQEAKSRSLPSVVITFEPQPNEFFASYHQHSSSPSRLMRLSEKLLIMNKLGIDYVLCLPFNEKLAHLNPVDFVSDILLNKLKLKYLVVGNDCHFGYKRQGNLELLRQLGKKFGFSVDNIPNYLLGEERVSSTWIRLALAAGDMTTVHRLLGRNFFISGRVAHGDKRGRLIDFPTANLYLSHRVAPRGVFVAQVSGLQNTPVFGVANLGNRPTFGGIRELLEVHLFDFNKEIYGQRIYVELLHKLRDERQFSSFESLKNQISLDAKQARVYFSSCHLPQTNQ